MTEMTNPILRERVQRRLKRVAKHWLHAVLPRRHGPRPAFVLGYGRSGTTMLIDALEHDWRIEVYQENDIRIARDFLLVYPQLLPAIERCKAPVSVMKPILDSFAAQRLLDVHPDARVIWMMRDVDPVVRSALKKFGPSVAESLKMLVEGKTDSSWIARGIPESILHTLRALPTSTFQVEDWMALVWWSVNQTLSADGLLQNPRLRLIHYETLIMSPEETMRGVYDYLGLTYRNKATEWIQPTVKGPQKAIQLTPLVRKMCDDLSRQLHQRDAENDSDQVKPHATGVSLPRQMTQ